MSRADNIYDILKEIRKNQEVLFELFRAIHSMERIYKDLGDHTRVKIRMLEDFLHRIKRRRNITTLINRIELELKQLRDVQYRLKARY